MTETVLVADIGGTNARFALASIGPSGVTVGDPMKLRAAEFATIGEAADAFLDTLTTGPARACFAVAGPVRGDRFEFTNSPWTFEIAEMQRRLGVKRLRVVNDFAALAASVRRLDAEAFLRVKAGDADPGAPILVIGPGTGFGQALIVPGSGGDRIVATQGGHVAFAPQTGEEAELCRTITREEGRAPLEFILSGRGLERLYRMLAADAKAPLADEITKAVEAGGDPLALRAASMFCAILGAAAGEAVLATGALGGVVLGGGILPRIRNALLDSEFTARFVAKGRLSAYVDPVPVNLIIRDGAALIGAAAMLMDVDGAQGRN